MPGANAVFKSALSRSSYPKSNRSTHSARISDGSGSLVNHNQPNMHLATTGPGSAAVFPTATAERRTFRGYAPKK